MPRSPLSIVAALGVYASVCRELGEPLSYPGGGRYVNACGDSRLIAKAVEFCATSDAASNQTFNVVNGDLVDWRDVWPRVAAQFDLEVGPDRPVPLAQKMPTLGHVWERMAVRYGLRFADMNRVARRAWQYADIVLGAGQEAPAHNVMSPIELVQAGFTECQDTEDAVTYWLSRLQQQGVLPL